MIVLNNREYPWREGITITELIDENDFVYKGIVVIINADPVHESLWAITEIHDGDEVRAIHMMAGG